MLRVTAEHVEQAANDPRKAHSNAKSGDQQGADHQPNGAERPLGSWLVLPRQFGFERLAGAIELHSESLEQLMGSPKFP